MNSNITYFKEAGYGMMMHFGLYSLLAGEYRGKPYYIHRSPLQTNSLHIEYDYCYIKPFDCVDISTENDSFYCYPTKTDVVTKLAFATEELYRIKQG